MSRSAIVIGKLCKYERMQSVITNQYGFVFVSPQDAMQCFDGDVVELQVSVDSVGGSESRSGRMTKGTILRVVDRSDSVKVGVVESVLFDKTIRKRCARIYSSDAPTAKLKFILDEHTPDLTEGQYILFRQVHVDGTISNTETNVTVHGSVMDRRSDAQLANARTERWRLASDRSAQQQHEHQAEQPAQARRTNVRDQTSLLTFTIDPEESRDFDDALSWDEERNKFYVHIADVSNFVPPNSAIDVVARQQMFTLYLPENATLHLLPTSVMEQASLVPEQVRPAVTMEFDWDDSNKRCRLDSIYRSTIRSKYRFHYGQVQTILHGEELDLFVTQDVVRALHYLSFIAKQLKSQNPEGVTVSLPQWRFGVDRDGHIDSHWLERSDDDAHELVKQFMLLANREVAEELTRRHVKFPHRAHLPPSRLNAYVAESREAGSQNSDLLQQYVLMRNLTRAFYTIHDMEHFGVGASAYAHFTSPIRRYIDLVLHRILLGEVPYTDEQLENLCLLATHQNSVIERCVDLYTTMKRLDYWDRTKHLETVRGVIRTINSGGALVFLPDFVTEVFVSVQSLGGSERLALQSGNPMHWRGRSKVFEVGTNVRLRVSQVDYVRMFVRWIVT